MNEDQAPDTAETVTRAQVFRVYPTVEQAARLHEYFAVSRRLWNELVEYRMMLGRWHSRRWAARQRSGGKRDGYTGELMGTSLGYWVKLARESEPERWATVPAKILHGAVNEFAAAEKGYVELSKLWATPAGRRKLTGPPRRPSFRSAHSGPLTVRWQVQQAGGRCPATSLLQRHHAGNVRWCTVNIPGMGPVNVRAHRELPADAMVGQAVLAFDRMGAWRITLQYQTATPTTYEAPVGSTIGVDRGVAHTIVTSNGEAADVPAWTRREVERRNRCSQSMARSRRRNPCPADRWVGPKLVKGNCTCERDGGACWKTSNRYQARKTARAKLDRRRDRRVKDAVHKISARLAVSGETVAFEDLDIASMTRSAKGNATQPGRNVKAKAGLNREINARAWGPIVKQTEAKALIVVRRPAHYTSQRCPNCGHVDAANRPNQSTFHCQLCGYRANADAVAAWNVAYWDRTKTKTVRAAPSQDADTSGPTGQHVTDASRLPAQTTTATASERSDAHTYPVTRSHAGQPAELPGCTLTELVPKTWGINTARSTSLKRRSRHGKRRSRRSGDPSG